MRYCCESLNPFLGRPSLYISVELLTKLLTLMTTKVPTPITIADETRLALLIVLSIPVLILPDSVQAVFCKVRRRDEPHLVCDDAESWRMTWLELKQGVAVKDSVAQAAEGMVCIETVSTSFVCISLFNTCYLMAVVEGTASVS